MDTLIEPKGIVCGETLKVMERISPWLLGKMHKAKKKKRIGNNQPKSTEHGSSSKASGQILQQG
jgi:hypothetical protein